MYKKAGIIVGGLIIVIAVVIFVIASNASKKAENPDGEIPVATSTVQTTVSHTQTPVVAPVETTQATTQTTTQTQGTQPVETQPVETQQTQPEATQPVVDSTAFVKIDPASLPAYTDETDLGTVVGRNVYSYNHQVIYSILINTTTHGQLEWFTTLTNYNIADGTKLECTIRTFNASQTGTFPSIISVTAI